MQRVLGFLWMISGLMLTALGVLLWVAEDFITQRLPVDPRVLLPNLPQNGDLLLIVTGVFLIFLGGRLAAMTPGTRITAAFIQAVLGLLIFTLLYLLATANIPWSSARMRYITLGIIGGIGVLQFVIAYRLFEHAPIVETGAGSWEPFPICPRCGRRLDRQGRCPWHDVPRVFARLVDTETSSTFPIPLPGPSHIGTGQVQVLINRDARAVYRSISQDHAAIRYDDSDDRFLITDLESRNGTFVSGVRLDEREETLEPETLIKLGGASFRFEAVKRTQDQMDAGGTEVFDA